MNAAHLHIILNHFPIVGLVFSAIILTAAHLRRSEELARVGAACLIFLAVVSIAAYLTGKSAEEVVEHMPGISQNLVEAHAEAAFYALVLLELLGIIAAYGLFTSLPPKAVPRWLLPTLQVLSLVAIIWVAWTSHLGGRIAHPEVRPGFEMVEL